MSEKTEIERKFLIEMPKLGFLDIKKQLGIIQTYLKNGENGSQRRVRKITENGEERFIYTEKMFYSAVIRKEMEFEISPQKYSELLKEARQDFKAIVKKRICFEYREQLFELDIYPFSDSRAILELELEKPEQDIIFPEYINIIKEVTGSEEYSNAALGTAEAFPSEASAEGDN